MKLVEHLERENARLREALRCLYDHDADYIRRNELGSVHHNRAMRMARDALSPLIQARESDPFIGSEMMAFADVMLCKWTNLSIENRRYALLACYKEMRDTCQKTQATDVSQESANGDASERDQVIDQCIAACNINREPLDNGGFEEYAYDAAIDDCIIDLQALKDAP